MYLFSIKYFRAFHREFISCRFQLILNDACVDIKQLKLKVEKSPTRGNSNYNHQCENSVENTNYDTFGN